MKKIIYILVLCLLSFSQTFAVSGHITENTTWSTNQIVTGDIWIDAGVTLTISAGVSVLFPFVDQNADGIGDLDFFINGRLLTQGTPTSKVYFKSNETSPGLKDWGGIKYTTASTGELSTLSNTEILNAYQAFYINGRNVTFNGCRIAQTFTAGLYIQSTIYTTTLNNTIIENCNSYGLRIEQGTLIINDLIIRNNLDYGFYIQNSNVTLTNAVIQNNTTYGLKASTGTQINATGLTIKNSGQEGLWVESTTAATFTNCRIVSNLWDGIRINNDNPSFTNCLIADNKRSGVIVTSAASVPSFDHCSFYENWSSGIIFTDGSTGPVTYCNLKNNPGTGISVIENSHPTINYCNIYTNSPSNNEIIPTDALNQSMTYAVHLPMIVGLTNMRYSARTYGHGYGNLFDNAGNQLCSEYGNNYGDSWAGLQNSGSSTLSTNGYMKVYQFSYLNNRTQIQLATSNTTGVINAQNNYWGQVNGVNERIFQNAASTVAYDIYQTEPVAGSGCNLVNNPPTLTLTAPIGFILNPATVNISWTDSDDDNDAKISLYYTTANDTTGGVLIVGNISEDDPTNSYSWNPSSIPDGTYHIYGKITDGINPTVQSLAPGTIIKGPLKVNMPTDAIGIPGTTVQIPVKAMNTIAYYNIISFQFTLAFNTSILTATGVNTDACLSQDWQVFYNLSVPGQIAVNGYSTVPLNSSGDLLKIIFDVNPNAANLATSPLNFADFTFNTGNPNPTKVDGLFTAVRQYQITGSANYYFNNNPIPELKLTTMVSGVPLNVFSNIVGAYTFPPLLTGTYIVTPSYDKPIPALVITPLDASITARFALSLFTLTNDQQKAADVDNNNNATVYDAALIAQYSVGLINSFPAGKWLISPTSNTYNLISNLANQNYKLTVVGDPTGNWIAPSKGSNSAFNCTYNAQAFSELRIPIHATAPFYSYLINADYDTNNLIFLGAEFASQLESFAKVENNIPGLIRMGGYDVNQAEIDGSAITLVFQPLISGAVNVNISVLFDETPGVLTGLRTYEKPTFFLDQNYPNPFSKQTTIMFGNDKRQLITLSIYDIYGRLMNSLLHETMLQGVYNIPVDVSGLSSGQYFYTLINEDGEKITKIMNVIK